MIEIGECKSNSVFIFPASSHVSLHLMLRKPRDTLQSERAI